MSVHLLKSSKPTIVLQEIILCCGSTGVYQAAGGSTRGDTGHLHGVTHCHSLLCAILGPRMKLAVIMLHLSLNRNYSLPQISKKNSEVPLLGSQPPLTCPGLLCKYPRPHLNNSAALQHFPLHISARTPVNHILTALTNTTCSQISHRLSLRKHLLFYLYAPLALYFH